jgi:hypothetical protein
VVVPPDPVQHSAGLGRGARKKNGPALAGHGAEAVRDAVAKAITTLPEQLRRSLTWDQGAEMAQHAALRIEAGIDVYFCDPRSPWSRALGGRPDVLGTDIELNGVQHTVIGVMRRREHGEPAAAARRGADVRNRDATGAWRVQGPADPPTRHGGDAARAAERRSGCVLCLRRATRAAVDHAIVDRLVGATRHRDREPHTALHLRTWAATVQSRNSRAGWIPSTRRAGR